LRRRSKLLGGLRHRQFEFEACAVIDLAGHGDAAAVQFENALYDCESEAGGLGARLTGRAVGALEDPR
jgi:hypothetical protein